MRSEVRRFRFSRVKIGKEMKHLRIKKLSVYFYNLRQSKVVENVLNLLLLVICNALISLSLVIR